MPLSQREAFARSRLARLYRALLDRVMLGLLGQPARVLDVGAGEGILLERLRGRGSPALALALDRHPENARICRSLGLLAVTADAEALPVADEAFDAVLLTNMLEHVDDPRAALLEARRVVRAEGVVLVVVPHEGNFHRARRALGRREAADWDYGHVRRWDPASLREQLRLAGLRVVSRRNLPLPYWPLALHHLVIARPVRPPARP